MKTLVLFTLVVMAAPFAHAQADTRLKWTVTMEVVGENGQPISGADASVDYGLAPGFLKPSQRDWDKIEGLTDTNGVFVASHGNTRTFTLGIQAKKNGYYKTRIGYGLSPYWNPNPTNWNPTIILTLKKVGKPIAMYAKQEETKLQEEGKVMGFDLMAGDWVTPYGVGSHTDMFFAVHRKIVNEHDYDCTLTVSFPNKGDGIVVAPSEPDSGSEFKTSRIAAENGYQPELVLHYSNTEQPKSVFGYFIRIRTVMDEDGTIKSALYGKISGDFRFYAGTIVPRAGMGFTYYLNPTPNDRNVEFDLGDNLIKNLKFDEAVKAP